MLSIINEIKEARGHQKLEVMERVKGMSPVTLSEFKSVLSLTYNPYLRFGIQKTTYPESKGNDKSIKLILHNLSFLEHTKFNAEHLKSHLDEHCHPVNLPLIRKIVLKDLRCGINVKSINKVFPGLIPTFDVMLAQKVNWSRVVYPCWSDIKLDGVRCIVTKDAILTRSGREILGCDHILEQCNSGGGLSPGIGIDGELMVKGLEFDGTSGNIRSHGDSPDAVFYMFDVAYFDERIQMPYTSRRESLHKLCNRPSLYLCPRRMVADEREAKAHFIEVLNQGHEGTILKPQQYLYEGKRSHSWMKIKDKVTHDLMCVGFYEGEGRFEGMLGGIIVDKSGVEVRVGGGFSDAERLQIWENQRDYLDVYAEVYGQEDTAAGSIRHPQFDKWRHDL